MNVLIADDHPDSTETLAVLCRHWGFEPVIAHDGQRALAILRQPDAPNLCLLDWQMPGMTGIEICKAVRGEADRPYRYLILITGRGDRARMVEGLEAGADDFLVKPIDGDELRARLFTGRRVLELQDELLRTMARLKEQVDRDGLTGLWNRSAIFGLLERELARGARDAVPVSVVLIDVDHFKQINDRHGHQVGDEILRGVAERLRTCLRTYDSVGRYGGEEFLVVLPGCEIAEATLLAERLRKCVAETAFEVGRPLLVTVSLGVASGIAQPLPELVGLADDRLYRAKHSGRNRVVGEESP